MSKKIKKLLTLDQLAQFCETNKFYDFSSQDTGYTLSVQVPGYFEAESDSTKGLLFTKLRVCHTEINKNHSYISEDNMKKAMPSLKYRPVLGSIHQLDDGTYDFHSHDMEIVEDENGNEVVNYIEQQIGTFTADEPYLEYNAEHDKTYVMANAVIPMEYTKAADIIERKNGTKVSCELCIDTMSYNAKEKALELEDFYFSGCTCLGSNKDGTEIGEGMEGSRLDIQDFSTENNGVFSEDSQSKMIEALEKLNLTLSKFNINGSDTQENFEEGGKTVTKFEELLEKYSKTEADITFEVEGLTDEELEAKFAEAFAEDEESEHDAEEGSEEDTTATEEETSTEEDTTVTETASEENGDSDEDEETTEETEEVEDETETTETEACGGSGSGSKKKKKHALENGDVEVTFEISHDDIRSALYNLIEQFDELDNEYYYISEVYDDKFIMEGWSNSKVYGCKYSTNGDNVALEGERYRLYVEYLTESEKAELDSMRSNYAILKAEKENTQMSELLASTDYAVIAEADEYKALVEDHAEFTYEDLKSKLDGILLDYAKSGKIEFSAQTERTNGVKNKRLPISDTKKKSRYGSLFSK